jgi:indolepyruvate ferredoxin oxidoreductase beta subunit
MTGGDATKMPGRVTNVVLAGLGGQGILTASDILARAALLAGHDVKKAEVHGMSQRGGFVMSDVRFGDRVLSPMVPPGEADLLMVLEETQIEAARPRLRSGGILLTPERINVAALPSKRVFNTAMLGVASRYMDLPEALWIEAIRAELPERLHAMNETAFRMGREAAGSDGLTAQS